METETISETTTNLTKEISEPEISPQGENSRLGCCEVCAFHNAKYTCPKCEVKTCSLKCNKIHKLEIECDGARDKTKFIPLNKFSNLDLSSDYRLLEEITSNFEAAKKKFGRRFENEMPLSMLKLRNAAKMRKTNLKFLPYKFARRRNNSSQLNFKSNVIYWHIDWVFVNANNLKISDRRVAETMKLGSAVNKFFQKQEDEVLQEKLQFYQSAGITGVRILLKAEQKGGKKYYELDSALSIKESLKNKLIIEYPTILLVLKDHSYGYNVIDSDNEEEEAFKSGKRTIDNIVNNNEHDDEGLYSSLKNLLFISEYSEDEMSDN